MIECVWCGAVEDLYESMTPSNADRIRTLSDEEL